MKAWGRSWVSFSNPFVCLFVYLKCMGTRVPPHSPGGQKTAFRGQFFPSILLSQGLSSSCCTALCTSGELARDRLSSSSVPTTRVVGWQVVSPHWALFKCRVQGLPSCLSGLTLFPQSQSLLWNLELTNSARMADQQGTRILSSLPPSARMMGLPPIADLLCGCWRSKLWQSCWCSKYFNNSEPPLQPSTRHWKQTFMLGAVGWWWSLHTACKAVWVWSPALKQTNKHLFISQRATFQERNRDPNCTLRSRKSCYLELQNLETDSTPCNLELIQLLVAQHSGISCILPNCLLTLK